MRRLVRLLMACGISIAAYCVLFGFVVSRPLVIDEFGAMLRAKLAYGHAATWPKVVILAGSNARFSHSCAVIERRLQRPCVNFGIAGDIGLDWVLDAARSTMRAGDLVYLPLELTFYSNTRTRMLTGSDAAYRWRHDKASLWSRGPEGVVRAMFMFDLRGLIDSLAEMALSAGGFERRIGVATLNAQGDEIGHTDEQAKAYESFLKTVRYVPPDPAHLLDNPNGVQSALASFLDWCRQNGVTVVGGLPTVFDDTRYSDSLVERLREFYARHDAAFVALPNRSQYPRLLFFDTPYHLRERAQLTHSEMVADALLPFTR